MESPLPAGVGGYAPDPVGKTKKEKQKQAGFSVFLFPIFSKYLIPNCEENDYYLSSHTTPRGFSHGKTKSQSQHTKH
jgi:hypothetical protein